MRTSVAWMAGVALLFGAAACGGPLPESDADAGTGSDADAGPPCQLQTPGPDEAPYERLRDYCFFRGDPADQDGEPSEGVVPYAVRSKLYSDESEKFRFIVVPEGKTIDYDRRAMWGFPEGTIIVKTFYYPNDARNPDEGRRLLETRLLMKRNGDWEPQVYKFNEEQTRAERHLIGADVEVEWRDESGQTRTTNYRVPNKSKCKSCHVRDGDISLLGPRTRQLNRTFEYSSGEANQIERFQSLGLLDEDPTKPVDDLPQLADPKNEDLSIERRARAYLEGNCAHCHDPAGSASNSGLSLGIRREKPKRYGVCKRSVAAGGGTGGNEYDIKPGYPEESIMVFRMKSSDPEIKMPELPLRTVDSFGVDLVSRWIANMRPKGCSN